MDPDTDPGGALINMDHPDPQHRFKIFKFLGEW
jgi:hypothetical protein